MMSRSARDVMIGWLTSLALLTAATAGLLALWDPAYLDSDAAQYLTTASNLVAGDGPTTDIIYYDEHYRSTDVPAPQTVFPPGLPAMLAGLLALGLSVELASFVAGLLAFGATGLLVHAVCRRLGVSNTLAVLACGCWLFLGLGWANVLVGRAEVAYTLATLAAVAICVGAQHRAVVLAAAGAAAAASLLLRYQGLFFVAALAIWAALVTLRSAPGSLRSAIRNTACVTALPGAVALMLVWRNWSVGAGAGGGPIDTVRAGLEPLDVVRGGYWMISELTGLSLADLRDPDPVEWLVVAGLTGLAVIMLLTVRTSSLADGAASARVARTGSPATDFVWITGLYCAITLLALAGLSLTRAGAYLQGRFLVPLVPFLLIVGALWADRWLARSSGRLRAGLMVALAALLASLLVAQAEVLRQSLDDMRADQRGAVVRRAVMEPMGATTVGDFLRNSGSRGSPLVAEPGQQLWFSLRRPVLGITPAGFSTRVWDEDAIRRLRACYGAELLVFFPSVFRADAAQNANKLVFIGLSRGEVPDALHLLHRGQEVEIYEVRPRDVGDSCPEPPR